jgi:hypothetical protein
MKFIDGSTTKQGEVVIIGANLTLDEDATGRVRVNSEAGGGSTALDDLTDVIITSPSTNELLVYNGANWVNADVPAHGTAQHTGTIGDASQISSGTFPGNYVFTGTADFNDTVTISAPNSLILSDTATASGLNGGSAIYMDLGSGRYHKAITWNDGGGNWNFYINCYYDGANMVYTYDSSGAARQVWSGDTGDSTWYVQVSVTGTADATISWANRIRLTTTAFEAGPSGQFSVSTAGAVTCNTIGCTTIDGTIATFTTGTFSAGNVYIGVSDDTEGSLYLYGAGAGPTTGGRVLLYTAANYDSVVNYYSVQAFEDDFRVTDGSTVLLIYQRDNARFDFTATPSVGGTQVSLTGHSHATGDIISGTFPIARGGTNATSYTINQFLWYNGTAIVASGYTNTSFVAVSDANVFTNTQTIQVTYPTTPALRFQEAASGVAYMTMAWNDATEQFIFAYWDSADNPRGSVTFDSDGSDITITGALINASDVTAGTFSGNFTISGNLTHTGVIIFSGDYAIRHSTTAGYVRVVGGNTVNDGGNVIFYGSTASGNQGDIVFRGNTTEILRWDDSLDYWIIAKPLYSSVGNANAVLRWGAAYAGALIRRADGGGLTFKADGPIVLHAGDNEAAIWTELGYTTTSTTEEVDITADGNIRIITGRQAGSYPTNTNNWRFSNTGVTELPNPLGIAYGGTNAASFTSDYLTYYNGSALVSWIDKDLLGRTDTDVTWGGYSYGATLLHRWVVASGYNVQLRLGEVSDNYGWSWTYNGSNDDDLYLRRHDNNSGGSNVVRYDRGSALVQFYGNISIGGSITQVGSVTVGDASNPGWIILQEPTVGGGYVHVYSRGVDTVFRGYVRDDVQTYTTSGQNVAFQAYMYGTVGGWQAAGGVYFTATNDWTSNANEDTRMRVWLRADGTWAEKIRIEPNGNLLPTGGGNFGSSTYPIGQLHASGRAYFSATDDVDLSGVSGAVIIGSSDGNSPHLAFDTNEIMSKSNATTAATLHLNANGGSVESGCDYLALTATSSRIAIAYSAGNYWSFEGTNSAWCYLYSGNLTSTSYGNLALGDLWINDTLQGNSTTVDCACHLIPTTNGNDLGSTSLRWDAYLQHVVVYGQSRPNDMFYPTSSPDHRDVTGTLTINWNNGNVQAASMGAGSLTINVDSSSNMYEGGTYHLVVYGPASGSQNLIISGGDTWVGTDYSGSTSISAGECVTVNFIKIRDRGDTADWVVAVVICDAVTVPV